MGDDRKPWWADGPQLAAIRRQVVEELDRARREPVVSDEPDPVVADIFSGASCRSWPRHATTSLEHAPRGLSWGEIGRILGVSKQLLHRRFSRPAPTAAP